MSPETDMPLSGTGFGHCVRMGAFRFRAVYRRRRFIGFVWFENRTWKAALPEPSGTYPFLTDPDGRVVRWTTRDRAAGALHMLADGIPLWGSGSPSKVGPEPG